MTDKDTPQTENGYTQIANQLLEQLLLFPFTKRELTVILCVIRKTYGFRKKFDHLSMYTISDMTGVHRTHVGRCVEDLLTRCILTERGDPRIVRGQSIRCIGINKRFRQWLTVYKTDTVKPVTVSKTDTVESEGDRIQNSNGDRIQNGTTTVYKTATTKETTKEIKRKGKNGSKNVFSDPANLNKKAWEKYQAYLRTQMPRIHSTSMAEQAQWLAEQGDDETQMEIVSNTTRNCWKGLFKLKSGGSNGNQRQGNRAESSLQALQRACDGETG